MSLDLGVLDETLTRVRQRLLDERVAAGHWEGRLSSSALATAVASFALAVVGPGKPGLADLVRRGFDWLAATQNSDGGWGDSPDSPSNISTTLLCWSAMEIGRAHV